MTKEVRLAVLVPCFNEARTVARVVADFRAALPDSTVFVYDNGSTDGTDGVASTAGAVVRHEPRPGKGVVVRRMFAEIEADIYVLADGDATYDATCAPAMVAAPQPTAILSTGGACPAAVSTAKPWPFCTTSTVIASGTTSSTIAPHENSGRWNCGAASICT